MDIKQSMILVFACIDCKVKHLLFRKPKDWDVQKWANKNAKNLRLFGITHIEIEEI